MKITTPRNKPLFIFDGDCSFCRKWVSFWQSLVEEKVEFSPYQMVAPEFNDIPIQSFKKASQYVEPDGTVTNGALAVFKMLSHQKSTRWMFWSYNNVPGFKVVSHFLYSLVARHRVFFSFLTRLIWGDRLEQSRYVIARWVFIKLIGVIYFIAFASLGVQILGLIGSEGILPAQDFLPAVKEQLGGDRFFRLPTLFWFGVNDQALVGVCIVGAVLSIALIAGFVPTVISFLLWFLYLSLLSVSQVFLSFQWDILLLEAGFLTLFLSSWQLKTNIAKEREPNGFMIWIFKWLLFRLMFTSGMVKLASGDPTWHHLTALEYHYETQPIPTWTSWFAHQLPFFIQRLSVAGMFFIELIVPFFIFAPGRLRYAACILLIGLQVVIGFTGNYTFFNLLSVALCVFLLDDSFWPQKIVKKVKDLRNWSPDYQSGAWSSWIISVVFLVSLILTTMQFTNRIGIKIPWPKPLTSMAIFLSPYHSFNSYGLFANMTTERPEIVIDGSMDGKEWKVYEFKYKPGRLDRRPEFVQPHQPRLDWQMWFAALGSYRYNTWFVALIYKLLQASPPVLDLLELDPFHGEKPKYIRATVYKYNFTDGVEKKDSGNWWKREQKGLYLPILTLQDGKLAAVNMGTP